MGMVTDRHLRRCELAIPLFYVSTSSSPRYTIKNLLPSGEEELLKFREDLKKAPDSSDEGDALWLDFANKWFTLMHSVRPFILKNFHELADHVNEHEPLLRCCLGERCGRTTWINMAWLLELAGGCGTGVHKGHKRCVPPRRRHDRCDHRRPTFRSLRQTRLLCGASGQGIRRPQDDPQVPRHHIRAHRSWRRG
ncbi:hypothetical protein BHE74_00022980 [Ensete ventricosum]|nr:hypothetical protein GW17_00037489 [Ensete ventricosum]RWW69419.1 hypothetical protein BHE74_00022980 [Ensete ventricosum]